MFESIKGIEANSVKTRVSKFDGWISFILTGENNLAALKTASGVVMEVVRHSLKYTLEGSTHFRAYSFSKLVDTKSPGHSFLDTQSKLG